MCKRLSYLFLFVLVTGLLHMNEAHAYSPAGDPDLVAYWSFDKNSGTIAFDLSGNGNDGTLNGDILWVPGMFGSALEFNGSNARVVAPNIPFDNRSFTVTMWINAVLYTGEQVVFSQTQTAATNTDLHFRIGGPAGTIPSPGAVRMGFYSNDLDTPGGLIEDNNWYHITFWYDYENQNRRIYIDGVQEAEAGASPYLGITGDTVIGAWGTGQWFQGIIDDVAIYSRALTQEEIQTIMEGFVSSEQASNPLPEDGAIDVPRDTALSWTPGPYAYRHNVYLGTVLDDVNNADTADPLAVLVSQGQTDTTYEPGLLDFGQNYYWRIDEVNAPPDSAVFKGDLWSFAVEPFSYPIPGSDITARASSFESNKGPENTINGSGLDESGLLHSKISVNTMWLSEASEPNEVWIRYEFDEIYKLNQMWVWNYNAESILSLYGLKEVIVEHSLDGSNWTKLDNVTEFAAAPGTNDYAHNTTVDFNDVPVKYVRITANSNQGGGGFFNQYGLSEIRFLYIPVSAREPNPATRATDVALDVTLSWRAGREAASHDVYISDNIRAVLDRTADLANVSKASYGPLDLNLSTTYYWSVDEVNGLDIWESDIWNFTTYEYFVVDDFEDYNDFPPDEIWNTWIDGYGDPANGSTAGYPDPEFTFDEHFVETTIVHSGDQSMPYFYDNTVAPKSEITRTITSIRDWTQKGISALSLWYYGDVTNVAGPMYVTLNGSAKVDNEDATAAQVTEWTEWRMDLQDFADQGLDLANINTITIGFGDDSPGGSGLVLFDDLRLYGSP